MAAEKRSNDARVTYLTEFELSLQSACMVTR